MSDLMIHCKMVDFTKNCKPLGARTFFSTKIKHFSFETWCKQTRTKSRADQYLTKLQQCKILRLEVDTFERFSPSIYWLSSNFAGTSK